LEMESRNRFHAKLRCWSARAVGRSSSSKRQLESSPTVFDALSASATEEAWRLMLSLHRLTAPVHALATQLVAEEELTKRRASILLNVAVD